jgi:(heptosyl)LPS beta-1,4-glucosyltransferase
MKPTLTAIIITKNEETMIANCIDTLGWCDEILVIDSGSTDATIGLAEKAGARVVETSAKSFAEIRNTAISEAKGEWLFYIDADERVMPQLAKEILVQMETNSAAALTLKRQNMMYGKFFEHGGWDNEKFTRVFRRTSFKGWKGDIHESSVFEGNAVELHTPLIHLTHRNTIDGLKKTIEWTPMEAKLLHDGNTPPVKLQTIFRKGIMEFFRRAFLKQGKKDGMEGLIEAVVQGINRMLVYIQVWELQQQPSLTQKYQNQEIAIQNSWKNIKPKDLSPLLAEKEKDSQE